MSRFITEQSLIVSTNSLIVSGLTILSVLWNHILDGPPYTWNYSERALTFYYIAE